MIDKVITSAKYFDFGENVKVAHTYQNNRKNIGIGPSFFMSLGLNFTCPTQLENPLHN